MTDYTPNLDTCYVYLIEEGNTGLTKIGVSVDPEKRFQSLQTSNPRPLLLRYVSECSSVERASRLELYLHRKFDRFRLSGEWFSKSASAIIESVSGDFFLPIDNEFAQIDSAIMPKPKPAPVIYQYSHKIAMTYIIGFMVVTYMTMLVLIMSPHPGNPPLTTKIAFVCFAVAMLVMFADAIERWGYHRASRNGQEDAS